MSCSSGSSRTRRAGSSDASFLVQGTLYPDVIESGTSDAAKIKSHHNVGGLPEDMDFELVEPLRSLFKGRGPDRRDRARAARRDRVAPAVPRPGARRADHRRGHAGARWPSCRRPTPSCATRSPRPAWSATSGRRSPCCPTSARSGVMGDERTYAHPVIIRAVTSDDAMTADWARLPYDLLERMSSRIINEVDGVNRVAYDITSKPPAPSSGSRARPGALRLAAGVRHLNATSGARSQQRSTCDQTVWSTVTRTSARPSSSGASCRRPVSPTSASTRTSRIPTNRVRPRRSPGCEELVCSGRPIVVSRCGSSRGAPG